jgi:acyl-CoA thioester hydrolase
MQEDLSMPGVVYRARVGAEWVDYNGHMNDAAYAIVFSRSCDALMDAISLDSATRAATGQTLYTLQMMLHYLREVKEGAELEVSCRILEHDGKRLRVWFEMRESGDDAPVAASEQLLLSVSQKEGVRAAYWSAETRAALEALSSRQSAIPWPARAGQGIRLKKA